VEEASWAGWAKKAEWASWADWAESQERNPLGIKIGFLNLQWLWNVVQGDFCVILMWGFFLNSSRILKHFRKIQYVMPCNASYA
jgi:hypothetical protein